MIKFVLLTKNNKASILPVTVIAMFIMMIIAYACIKIFLVQNIIITQDQIKVRTIYAAAGIAEKQVMRLKAAIDTQINQDPNITFKDETTIDNTGIKNLNKKEGSTDSNYDFIFSDILTRTAGEDPDVVPGQSFFTAEGINGSSGTYTNSMLESVTMFPHIKCSTVTITRFYPPSDGIVKDPGIIFYKTKGITITEGNTIPTYVDIDGSIAEYSYKGDLDPRTEDSRSLGFEYDSTYGDLFVEFYITVSSFTSPGGNPLNNPRQHLFRRFKCPTNVSPDSAVHTVMSNNLTNVKIELENRYSSWSEVENELGPADEFQNLRLTAWAVRYKIKNEVRSYLITAKVQSDAVSNKIPAITSQVRIGVGLYMTKLSKQYATIRHGGSTGDTVWWLNRAHWDPDWPSVTTWQAHDYYDESTMPNVEKTVVNVSNTNPYIKGYNNIKFYIQKWEIDL